MTALVTVTLTWGGTVALVVGAAALLAAVGFLVRAAVKAIRWVKRAIVRIRDLLEDELTHNHGSSIKDDVHGMAVAVGTLQRDLEGMKRDLYHHLARSEPDTP